MEPASVVFLWYPRTLVDDLYAHWTVGQLRTRIAAGPPGASGVCYDEGLKRLLDDWIGRGYKETIYAQLPWATGQDALLGYELLVDATLEREWRAQVDFFLRHARVLAGEAGKSLDRTALRAVCDASRRGKFDWRTWPPLAALIAEDSHVLNWEHWQELFQAPYPVEAGQRVRPEQALRQNYERFVELRNNLLAGEIQGLQLVIMDSEEPLCPYPVPALLRADLEHMVTEYRAAMQITAARWERRRRVLRVVAPVILVGLALIYTAAVVIALPGGMIWWIPLAVIVVGILLWLMRT
jgi:hypothetical protein